MTYVPDQLYASIEASIPIVCTDFIMVRRNGSGRIVEVGLIERESPYGRVWCSVGGRIRRGESIRAALLRHQQEALTGIELQLPDDPQPRHVFQFFPEELGVSLPHPIGADARKHSVGLTFVIDVVGDPVVVDGGEALSVGFFSPDALPDAVWPGCAELFATLLASESIPV